MFQKISVWLSFKTEQTTPAFQMSIGLVAETEVHHSAKRFILTTGAGNRSTIESWLPCRLLYNGNRDLACTWTAVRPWARWPGRTLWGWGRRQSCSWPSTHLWPAWGGGDKTIVTLMISAVPCGLGEKTLSSLFEEHKFAPRHWQVLSRVLLVLISVHNPYK